MTISEVDIKAETAKKIEAGGEGKSSAENKPAIEGKLQDENKPITESKVDVKSPKEHEEPKG